MGKQASSAGKLAVHKIYSISPNFKLSFFDAIAFVVLITKRKGDYIWEVLCTAQSLCLCPLWR